MKHSILHKFYASKYTLPVRICLAGIYGSLVFLRNRLYDFRLFNSYSVSVPVVSVGNLTMGGSGKTILVQALIDFFLDNGLNPAVLSRGYGRSTKGLFVVSDGNRLQGDAGTAGDEPYLIARRYPGVPVVVSKDRLAGAEFLISTCSPAVIILDDGFQHRRLQRDVDILVLDQPEQIRSHMLPWGKNREFSSEQKRADLVIHSKAGKSSDPDFNLHITTSSVLHNLTGEDNKTVPFETYGIFAGLGNNAAFFESVEAIFGQAKSLLPFPDHNTYSDPDLRHIEAEMCPAWITSEKDIVKLSTAFCQKLRIYFVRAEAVLPRALRDHLKHYFKL